MGGPGSTRWEGRRPKRLVEQTPRLDVWQHRLELRKSKAVELAACDRSGLEHHHRKFQVARLPLRRGGYRLRLVCSCGRRCRFLYFVRDRICCQKCGNLLHQSTRTWHDWPFEKLFREICRDANITGLKFNTFRKYFQGRSIS